MKYQLGITLPREGAKVVSRKGRLFSVTPTQDKTSVLIFTSIEELEKVLKKAKEFKRSRTYKKLGGLYYKHLSPDVTIGFLSANHPWLKGPKNG